MIRNLKTVTKIYSNHSYQALILTVLSGISQGSLPVNIGFLHWNICSHHLIVLEPHATVTQYKCLPLIHLHGKSPNCQEKNRNPGGLLCLAKLVSLKRIWEWYNHICVDVTKIQIWDTRTLLDMLWKWLVYTE